MKRIGILTSGGDCPGLNSTIRGITKTMRLRNPGVEIVGITGGYTGLIEKNYKVMAAGDFDDILTVGGTVLGTSRQPFKTILAESENSQDSDTKLHKMLCNYKELELDCLCTLGGNGTHKTANLLSSRGLKVIALPKTIDNDIWGTDETFGYNTATELGTTFVDRLHSTAASHSRVMVVEVMGNKFGWLALSIGVAAGADAVIIPEMPYNIDKINAAVENAVKMRKTHAVIIAGEGAFSEAEAQMKRKERLANRAAAGHRTIAEKLAAEVGAGTGIETRSANPGHYLRGGTPSAYDRMLTTQFGSYAAELICNGVFGVAVAKKGGVITHNNLADIAGKPKPIPADDPLVVAAKNVGISFGV